ncbi:iron hydrogenase [Pyronema omphalodes]|nr:iron hydrogenase [Pyronema omphalodes]
MSAILSADALNDFIAPSVECIKPVESLPEPQSNELAVGIEGTMPDTRTAAQISLTDCLACSGCVTSSEAVLVSMQSHNEVLSALQQFSGKTFVALLSPQSRAALAVALQTTEQTVTNMVTELLTKSLGEKQFEMVVDTNPFRQLSLHYASEEVLNSLDDPERKRPILTSACPGFICYLESTHPILIPHLSTLKSPQAIGGTFLKALMIAEGRATSPDDIYVVSIMPCFDKKLEGARGELTSTAWQVNGTDGTPIRDVDCVITTRELLSLAEAKGIDFPRLSRSSPPTPIISNNPTIQKFLTTRITNGAADNGTSGGNLTTILSSLLARHPGSTVTIQPGRNVDTRDYLIVSPSGEIIAKLSRCYGFRNIQNLVRKLKPAPTRVLPTFGAKKIIATPAAARRVAAKKSSSGDDKSIYVEVMACPGGCTNGGGQIKWDDEDIWKALGLEQPGSQKDLLARVDEAYYSASEEQREEKDTGILGVVGEFLKMTGLEEERLVRTGYRQVANDIGNRLGEKEALAVASRNDGGW